MPRIRYGSLARIVVILCLFCLWLQIMLSASSGGMYREDISLIDESIELKDLLIKEKSEQDTSNPKLTSKSPNNTKKPEELMNANDTSEQVLALVPPELHKYLTVHTRNSTINATEKTTSKNISDIRRAIEKYNDAQNIINEDIFGPVQNNTIIIAIQVHTRLTYLRHLIVSLAQARDIDKTLLVFSHDYYDEEVNALVRSIDFTKVLQIFYPYSIQVHPHEFPGIDPNDCPRDAKFEQAVKLKCNNAHHPDLHGHYREAKYTQTKHHWWWKANRIFNQLRATSSHSGMVLFLEEDHYVAEDFLHILSILRGAADRSCPHCEILSLGTYLKTYQYHVNGDKRRKQLALSYAQQRTFHESRKRQDYQTWNYQVFPNLYASTQKRRKHYMQRTSHEESRKRHDYQTWNYQVFPNLYASTQKVEITPWHSSMHNMGFAFNRTVWNNIMELQDQFCAYDDYNWDYSLLHLSQNRPGREKFKVIMCKGPRVFHIGECGFHHKKSNCNASTVISKVQKLLQTAKSSLYPSRVTATVTAGGTKHNKKLTKGNGGWGDIRDQELCTNMTKVGREPRKYPYYL